MRLHPAALLFATFLASLSITASQLVGQSKLSFRVVYIEVGFVSVSTEAWTPVSTVGLKFKHPFVIMGMPRDGTGAINGGYQSCFRLKDVKFDAQHHYTLNVIVKQPNDTW